MTYGRHTTECRNRCRESINNNQATPTCDCRVPVSPITGTGTVCPPCVSNGCTDRIFCRLCPVCPTANMNSATVSNQNCLDRCIHDRRKERRDRPIANKFIELPLLPFRLLEAQSFEEVLEIIEDEFPGGTTGAAATAGITSLAGVAPAPLPMFPPSGLPQPQGFQPGTFNLAQSTTSLIGGGALPSAALTVIAKNIIYINDEIDR